MTKLISAAERLIKARKLIQKARDLPVPDELGRHDFSYVAQVKDLMRQARDLIKFIPYSVTATPELKAEVAAINRETEQTQDELLHGKNTQP